MTDPSLARVVVVALGGTIAAPVDHRGTNAQLAMTADDLLASVPQLADVANVRAITFRMVISADLDFEDIASLATEIDSLASSGVDGVVITLGTDTLEEVAFLLDQLIDVDIVVVLTGAMRNVGAPGADGAANLVAAVRVAASPTAKGLGALVVVNDEIHAARHVRKAHTTSPAAFDSRPLGPIGWVIEGRVRIALLPRNQLRPFSGANRPAVWPAVALLTLSFSDDDRLIRLVPDTGYSGLVIEVFGAGHTSRRTLAALVEVAARIPVVFANRTGSGEMYEATGAFVGSERDLLDGGLISAVALTGTKARVLLSLALTESINRAGIAAHFENAVS